MNSPMRLDHNLSPKTRGIHHLALNTDDMKMTIDFYTRVLEMPLIHALRVPPGVGIGKGNRGNPPFENLRHYFFDAGGDTMVAFFELPKGQQPTANLNAVAAMQHCSFTTTQEKFNQLHQNLIAEGVSLIGPVGVGSQTWSLYFYDPNGIRLELSWQEHDHEDVHVVERWTQSQEEIMQELQTLSDDHEWLSKVTHHLSPERAS